MNHNILYNLSFLLIILISPIFSIDLPTWNVTDAESKLLYSYAVFCGDDAIMKWNCYWCKKTDIKPLQILHNQTTEAYGFIGVHRNQIIVTFRGSKSILNWINNFRFFKVPYKSNPNLLVHQGFYDSYNSIKDQLLKSLVNITRSYPFTNEIVFTGHSHGAALSIFASIDTYESNLFSKTHKISTINFGCPRVGDKNFAKYFESRIPFIRLTYSDDIVVRLPPTFFDYHHSVREVWEEKSRVYKLCSLEDGEDPSCSNSRLGLNLDDHLFYMGYHIKDGNC